MLGVVQDAYVDPVLGERIAEGRHRAIAATGQLHGLAAIDQDDVDRGIPVDVGLLLDRLQRESAPGRRGIGQVLGGEHRPHLLGRDLATLLVGDPLDHLRELDLEPARELELVFGAHDVGDAALAGL